MGIIELDKFRTSTGEYLSVGDQKRIEALLRNPSLDNWKKAKDILIDGYRGYLWKYVVYIAGGDIEYADVSNVNPPVDIIRASLILAQESIIRGYGIVAGKIKKI